MSLAQDIGPPAASLRKFLLGDHFDNRIDQATDIKRVLSPQAAAVAGGLGAAAAAKLQRILRDLDLLIRAFDYAGENS